MANCYHIIDAAISHINVFPNPLHDCWITNYSCHKREGDQVVSAEFSMADRVLSMVDPLYVRMHMHEPAIRS
jgi:hypothetical protein